MEPHYFAGPARPPGALLDESVPPRPARQGPVPGSLRPPPSASCCDTLSRCPLSVAPTVLERPTGLHFHPSPRRGRKEALPTFRVPQVSRCVWVAVKQRPPWTHGTPLPRPARAYAFVSRTDTGPDTAHLAHPAARSARTSGRWAGLGGAESARRPAQARPVWSEEGLETTRALAALGLLRLLYTDRQPASLGLAPRGPSFRPTAAHGPAGEAGAERVINRLKSGGMCACWVGQRGCGVWCRGLEESGEYASGPRKEGIPRTL